MKKPQIQQTLASDITFTPIQNGSDHLIDVAISVNGQMKVFSVSMGEVLRLQLTNGLVLNTMN